MPVVNCDNCGKFVKKQPHQVEQNEHHFCCSECYHKWTRKRVKVSCDECGKVFERVECNAKRGEHNFCSDECQYKYIPRGLQERVSTECGFCGSSIEVIPAIAEKDKENFCDRDCYAAYLSTLSGEKSPHYERVEVSCDNCGEKIEKIPSNISEENYCCEECMSEAFGEKYSGKGNPSWDGGKENRECDWCGEKYKEWPSQDKRFCGEQCRAEWFSENFSGEDNPSWAGGYDGNYGEMWHLRRKEALARDSWKCQECGIAQEECREKHATGLHVHHKTPYRTFDSDEEAHALDNLVTLCPPCHREAERKS
jgi:hypothetical protein